tara:strand:- start:487 stop:744 length:258 start_codon:yes stop_codon:yes gene_type:complete
MKSRMTAYEWTGSGTSTLRTGPLGRSFYKTGVPSIAKVVIGSKINKFEIVQCDSVSLSTESYANRPEEIIGFDGIQILFKPMEAF